MKFNCVVGAAGVAAAAIVLIGPTAAGATRPPKKAMPDLSTNTAVTKYLRSIGISPRGVVIQRGLRNYAGPRCPGRGWNCTRARRVVQIAARGTLSLSAKPAGNVATCTRSSGADQSCVIVQSSTNVSNTAQVDETISQSGQSLDGKQEAQVKQTSTSGSNTAKVDLKIAQSATTTVTSASQNLTSSQRFTISQTSDSGAQSIQVDESSTQTETANSATTGTQYANGYLFGHFTQSSNGVSTAKITQDHSITESALGPNVEQTAVDPTTCCANQGSNPGDTATLSQRGSVQTTGDPNPNITAVQNATCQSSGNCSVTETQNTNGVTTTNSSSGSTVNTGLSCSGTTCTPGARFTTGDLFVSVANGHVQEWDVSGATPTLVRTLDTGLGGFTTGMAFDGADNLYVTDFSVSAVSKFAPPDG
jgi:hypothetical protein